MTIHLLIVRKDVRHPWEAALSSPNYDVVLKEGMRIICSAERDAADVDIIEAESDSALDIAAALTSLSLSFP
jgi:hypothetical protein